MSTQSKKERFIASLEELYNRDDRGALAALRCGLLPGREASVYPYVGSFLSDRHSHAYILVAALFALHPGTGGVSIGTALRIVASKTSSASVEGRFVALLNAHAEDLPVHLRHAVALARSKDVAIDWRNLLDAVLNWDREDGGVQRGWATDFWSKSTNENEEVAS